MTSVDEHTLNGGRGRIVLEGTDAKRNVFAVSAGAMALASGLAVRVPAGASAVINVSGAAVSVHDMGLVPEAGAQAAKILLNFPDATAIDLDGVNVLGSILAPHATLNFGNGTIGGTVVVAGAKGDGRYNWDPYSGSLP